MSTRPDTVAGTITLTAGATGFTASGVQLLTRGHLPGDEIYVPSIAAWLIIGTITGENAGSLAYPCPTDAAGTHEAHIRFQPDGSRVAAQARNLIELLSNRAFFEFDASGTLAERAGYNDRKRGFTYLDVTTTPMNLYVKATDASGDWAGPANYAQGEKGDPSTVPGPGNVLNIGTVTSTNGDPTVTITGNSPSQTLNFVLKTGPVGPAGPQGESFKPDETGPSTNRATFDGQPDGFSYLETDTGNLYFREGATSGVWSTPIAFGKGEKGDSGALLVTSSGVGNGTPGPYTLTAEPLTTESVWAYVGNIPQFDYTISGNQITFGVDVGADVEWVVKTSGPLPVAYAEALAPGSVDAPAITSDATKLQAVKDKLGVRSLTDMYAIGRPAEDFGAVGDGDGLGGGTNNASALATAFSWSAANGTPIALRRGKFYRCDTPLTHSGPGKLGFVGGGAIDFSNCTATTGFIVISGPSFTDTQPITATIEGPTHTVPISDATAYAPGDIIWLYTNEDYSTDVNSGRTEFAIVDSVSGNTLTTMNPIVSRYTFTGTLTNSRSVRKFHPTCIPILDLQIVGKFGGLTQPQSTVDADQKGIMLTRTAYAKYKVDSLHVADRAFSITESIFAMGEGVRAFNADQEGLGYAFVDGGNQWCSFGDIIGHNCRHVTSSGYGPTSGVSRENTFGDIMGFGCRDAVVDTHDGACDIKYGNILGSFKTGNSAGDAGLTMQGSRITTGDVTLMNFTGSGILIQFEGGDPNRDHYYKFGMVEAIGKTGATGAVVAVQNLSDTLAQDIELVSLAGLMGSCSAGITTAPTGGSIRKIEVGPGKVVSLNNHCLLMNSTSVGKTRFVGTGLELECRSTLDAHYPVYALGINYTAAHAGKFGAEIDLFGCNTKGGTQVHMRAYDGRIEIHGGSQEWSPTSTGTHTKYLKNGIGTIKTPSLVDAS